MKEELSAGANGALKTANPFHFVNNRPTSEIDALGLDVWVGDRPWSLHQNINVGDPNGEFKSFSFATDNVFQIFNPLNKSGYVYKDKVPADIIEDMYLQTTEEQDALMLMILSSLYVDSMNGKEWSYRLSNQSCRDFSQEHFELFKQLFGK